MHFLQSLNKLAESGGDFRRVKPHEDPRGFAQQSAAAVPSDVRMISGCMDSQTSADVSNVASFGLPAGTGPGGAGGACTNSLILAMSHNPGHTWITLLEDMQNTLKQKGYSQVPQLSSSRQLDLSQPVKLFKTQGRKRALLVGINYVGQQGQLSGCVNDVIAMRQFINSFGFTDQRILADDPSVSQTAPTKANILAGFKWLVEGASPGDSLFFHYSGHGGQARDAEGDEKDGFDETIIPVDYRSAGQIIDDVIFKELVTPLPEGCRMTVIMDCCHSGTVLDLPYVFVANAGNVEAVHQGSAPPTLAQNPNFNFEKILKIGMELYKVHQAGGGLGDMAASLGKHFFH
eukprot:TRINITY_DN9845_c0_g2_i1.p1 TRINITY_DN9845_c0_g2~~TRINITY_DN9845_c0_g2_i1.p1  ORF type:complete len:346 (+),score=46.71 TRINITY_DN9845_c0_g2_i1:467-1504(+)